MGCNKYYQCISIRLEDWLHKSQAPPYKIQKDAGRRCKQNKNEMYLGGAGAAGFLKRI